MLSSVLEYFNTSNKPTAWADSNRFGLIHKAFSCRQQILFKYKWLEVVGNKLGFNTTGLKLHGTGFA